MQSDQSTLMNTFFRWASSRVALNMYFWLFLFFIKHYDADDQNAYSPTVYYLMMLGFMSVFAFLSYFNNLFLQPKLLFAGKRFLYVLSAAGLIFVLSFVYTYLLKVVPIWLPGMNAMEMSMVMDPVSSDLSIGGILADMQTYFSMMLIWLTLFSLLGFYHHQKAKVKSMEATIAKHRETELHFLKNQLNPHFLFNTLNNLYALALRKSDEAPEVILKLSTVLRYMLYEADAKQVSFEQEKEIMQAYIDIELLRLQQSPDLHFSIVADKPYQLPPLLWLPVLENVFKHTRHITDLHIDFKFQLLQHKLIMSSTNTFQSSLYTTDEKSGGIGLTNLRKRLELLYPNQHKINEHKDEKMYTIEVTIYPL